MKQINMKKIILCLLFLIFFGGSNLLIISTNADNNLTFKTENSKDYHFQRVGKVLIKNLTITNDYVLMVANNTYNPKNISWIATEANAWVYFNYLGGKTDINNDTMTQLELLLIENNVIIDSYNLNMIYVDDWISWAFVIDILVWLLIIAIVLSALILIARIGLNFID